MSVFKPVFDAVGTGAGVAWPLFGILSSALSLGIGGAAMAGLGSVCCGLFLLVGLRVFYLSYKKSKAEEAQLNDKLHKNLSGFIDRLYNCYLEEDTSLNFPDYLNSSNLDREETSNRTSIQVQFIEFVRGNSAKFLLNYHHHSPIKKNEKLKKIIKAFINSSDFNERVKALPMSELLDGAFLNFVGVFGAVAGCSAGVIGVFSGLGLMISLSAIPFVGAAVLAAALFLGICGAVISVHANIEKNRKIQIYKNFKGINHNFDLEMNLDKSTREVEPPKKPQVFKPPEIHRDWRSESGESEKKFRIAKIRSILFYRCNSIDEEDNHLSATSSFEPN
ncbi:hypothetical protein [Legionella micdadei]|uniref:hypothetical protein n=1 Tax=Legionella micdadei TaxID=451 RepID=UPI0009EF78FD|nr:hypothetical protein [Legionella micdadei]ARH01126.1 hypothetical protein B6V88_12275 [Legionella micdadei]